MGGGITLILLSDFGTPFLLLYCLIILYPVCMSSLGSLHFEEEMDRECMELGQVK